MSCPPHAHTATSVNSITKSGRHLIAVWPSSRETDAMRHDGLLLSRVSCPGGEVTRFRTWRLHSILHAGLPVLCLTRLLSDRAYVPDRTACSAGCFSRLAFFYLSFSMRAPSSGDVVPSSLYHSSPVRILYFCHWGGILSWFVPSSIVCVYSVTDPHHMGPSKRHSPLHVSLPHRMSCIL